MSVKIIVNGEEPLVANSSRAGKDWEFVKVKGSGGDRKIVTIWVNNGPSGLESGDSFRVTAIHRVDYKSRKNPRGEWVDEFSINADVEKVSGPPEEMTSRGKTYDDSPYESPDVRQPTFYDINTGVDGDDGLPF